MSDREKREAFVTLATNDTYSLGCLVLGCSLRRVNTSRQLVVMVTTDVSNPMRSQLAQVYDHIQEVDLLDSKDPKNLSLLGRPDLNVTFTKLHCWRLTQFDKAVFLDADTLVLQNVDELFDREELSAAPDAGWPDCFNSGVFVFRPSEETYELLLKFAMSKGSFDGGDQGLLNLYFSNWSTDDISKHLPFIYNVVSQAFYSYLPAFTQFKDRVRIVHFIGAVKPWHQPYNTSSGTVTPLPGSGHSQEFLQVWWNIFMSMVQPTLDPSLAGLAGDLAHMSVGYQSPTRMLLSDKERKLNWEKGQIDYLGQDSFDNIQKKLDETLNKDEAASPPPSISSPFSPKEPPKEASKEVVLEPVKTVAVPPPKEVVPVPPKTVAVVTPKVQAVAPKVESAPAPKPAAAPTVKTTAAAPKTTTTAAPKAPPAPAPAQAPKVSAPAPKPAAAPTKVAATAAPTKVAAPAAPAKVAAPAAPAKVAAPVPAKTTAPAPAKTAAPAPAKTAGAPAPKATTTAAPKVASTAAAPKPGAAGDPKASAAAPKPAAAAPASKAPGFKAFGAKK